MKKILSLLIFCLIGICGWATDVVFDASVTTSGYETASEQTISLEGVTLHLTNGILGTSGQYRIYKGHTLTVSSETTITKIVFTCTANGTTKYGPGCFAAQEGYSYSGKIGTWEGEANSIAFLAEANQVRATSIVVTIDDGETPPPTTYYSVTLPNSLTGGTVNANVSNLTQIAAGTTVTITATPETGYELDWMKVNDEEVTNPYSFTINENKIVTAAFKEKSATITEVSTVAEFNELEDNTNFKFTGTLIVSGQTGKYLYAQDATGGILIYGTTGQTYNKLDVIPANWTGTKTTYNGAPEVKEPLTDFMEATTQADLAPEEMTPAQVTLANAFKYAVIRGATVAMTNGTSGTITVDDETVALYKRFNITIPTDGAVYDIIGITGYFNTPQFMPLEFVGASEPPTPTITEIATAAEFIALENNKEFKFTGDLVCVQDYSVSGTNSSGQPYTNRYLYVADETGGIVIYNPDASTPTYETKDVIPGGWIAKKTTYRNLPEATAATDFTEATETLHLDPIEMTIDAANNSTNYGAYVIIKNVLIRPQSDNMLMEESGPSTHDESVMITDGSNNIILYSTHTAPFNLPTDWETDTRYDVVGILGVYNSTQQIYPVGIKLNDETITSIETLNNGVKRITYYNVQGIESSEPFDGVNIVTIEYDNGTKKINKVIKR